jgi:hypothetical protein
MHTAGHAAAVGESLGQDESLEIHDEDLVLEDDVPFTVLFVYIEKY